ncbi:MAG: hypothetical protein ACRETG_12490 [Steroidobacteraceae bacterium]
MVLVDTNIIAYLTIAGDRTSAAQELYLRDSDWRSEGFVPVELAAHRKLVFERHLPWPIAL